MTAMLSTTVTVNRVPELTNAAIAVEEQLMLRVPSGSVSSVPGKMDEHLY